MEILGSNFAQFLRLRQITGQRDEHDSFAIRMTRAVLWDRTGLSWLELFFLVFYSLKQVFWTFFRICQFSEYLGTKLDMLFRIAKSIERDMILGKKLFYPKFLILC